MVSATALAASIVHHPPMPAPPDFSWVWNVPGVLPQLKPRDPVSLRIVEELMAAMLTRERAKRITLHNCDCLTETGRPRKDIAFPCCHVLAAAQDKALRLILKSEDLVKGVSGDHTLDRAARQLALRNPGSSGVWGDPAAKDGYRPSRLPVEATDAQPNTREKDDVFYERFKRGESLFHPDDPYYTEPTEWEGDGKEVDHDAE